MEKICVVLEIPALGQEYDMLIPPMLNIGEVVKLMTSAVGELSAGAFAASGQELLCRREGSEPLHPAYTLASYGIGHGEHLQLF